jgi:hypothetical protein
VSFEHGCHAKSDDSNKVLTFLIFLFSTMFLFFFYSYELPEELSCQSHFSTLLWPPPNIYMFGERLRILKKCKENNSLSPLPLLPVQ